jgi:hypothetical protein
MKWSDRTRDFVSFAVAGWAYHWWLHRQVRKHLTAKSSEAAMRKRVEGKLGSNAQLLAKAMEQERLLVSRSN